jgi:hypothetical protein
MARTDPCVFLLVAIAQEGRKTFQAMTVAADQIMLELLAPILKVTADKALHFRYCDELRRKLNILMAFIR